MPWRKQYNSEKNIKYIQEMFRRERERERERERDFVTFK